MENINSLIPSAMLLQNSQQKSTGIQDATEQFNGRIKTTKTQENMNNINTDSLCKSIKNIFYFWQARHINGIQEKLNKN